jgi:hypothetical protein
LKRLLLNPNCKPGPENDHEQRGAPRFRHHAPAWQSDQSGRARQQDHPLGQGRQTHPGHLHYRWTSDSPGLVPADAASVTMTTPAMPMAAEVFVEISNDKGGRLKLYITVPVKTAAPQQPSPFLRILTDNGMLFSILDDNGSL